MSASQDSNPSHIPKDFLQIREHSQWWGGGETQQGVGAPHDPCTPLQPPESLAWTGAWPTRPGHTRVLAVVPGAVEAAAGEGERRGVWGQADLETKSGSSRWPLRGFG